MKDFSVRLHPPYPVRLRATLAEVFAALREDQPDRQWFVVADTRVLRAHPSLMRALRPAERRCMVALTGGERVKSLRSLERLYRAAMEAGLRRDGLVVVVGGGTIGDLGGFFAATWMRGVRWCPVATTSLALADSAIGGKTAVDLAGVKNPVGAFHQPVGVYGALEALGTLPARHRRAGLAEVVKSAVVADRRLFERLERWAPGLDRVPTDPADLERWGAVLRAAARVKARVVARDPHEGGLRQILNFGHTLGHALEAVAAGGLLHGEAVALGMIAAARLSEQHAGAPAETAVRIASLLEALGLPRALPSVDVAMVWKQLSYDKKATAGGLPFVLTEAIGSASVGHRLPRKDVQAALRSLRGGTSARSPRTGRTRA